MAKEAKTNALRMLDKLKIDYAYHTYICEEFVDGTSVADKLGQPRAQTFKTIVTVSKGGKNYVFVLPVDRELDLKKCARAAGEKSLEPVHVKDINALTGYIRGGVSPIGMKKPFPTFIDASARDYERIFISGGRLGLQIELSPDSLVKACSGEFAKITFDT
ncbi:MAG: Cys-tRNA(Pro) deacylase [Oscillospiraceae bacterium]|nr:Cys-tRNA(Pro) deacylase [Oscillospiraceae bacterium]